MSADITIIFFDDKSEKGAKILKSFKKAVSLLEEKDEESQEKRNI
jgi:hypothetical protein